MTPTEYYRERNCKVRRVLHVHFGKQDVSIAAGWLRGRVTAKIDSDFRIGELIDLVRKLVNHEGIPPGRAANRTLEKRAPICIGDSATVGACPSARD
jgi:hypothetical protein